MTEDTAQDYAAQLGQWCRRMLASAGHTSCSYLGTARYIPESGMVTCGCGEFTETSGDPAAGTTVAPIGGTVPYTATDPIQSVLALIDASQIYTPDEVERHILDVLARLERGALFERECIRAKELAMADFDRLYWATIHTSEQSSELRRKAEAEVACEKAGLTAARNEAKMMADAIKATMHNLRAVLSGYQSTAKSVTATYQAGGSPSGRF